MRHVSIATLLCAVLAPFPAAAQERITLEITDQARNRAPETVHLSVPLIPHRTSRVETRIGSADHHVSVTRDDGRGTFHFDIRRVETERGPARSFELSVGVALRPGARAVLAHLRRPDGSTTEIVARRGAPRPAAQRSSGTGSPTAVLAAHSRSQPVRASRDTMSTSWASASRARPQSHALVITNAVSTSALTRCKVSAGAAID